MAAAIRLAARGCYTTRPNPNVGCIVASSVQQIVGRGYHAVAGQPHAEVHALQQAGSQARGGTIYVTLEPCCHQGKTPPCVDAILAAGITRVVCASEDPNPRVAGQGIGKLRAAGLTVEVGLLAESALQLNRGFFKRMQSGRPFITSKSAMSFDGCTAMASGESKWITGELARVDVQALRARHAAIMTGIGTVLHDDPQLTVRGLPQGQSLPDRFQQPLRVVIDARLDIPLDARILLAPGECVIYTQVEAAHPKLEPLAELGIDVVRLPAATTRIPLVDVYADLASREINEVLIEAGPTLTGQLIEQHLVDEMIVYVAPHLMGSGGRRLFNLAGISQMSERVALKIIESRMVGQDMRFTIQLRD